MKMTRIFINIVIFIVFVNNIALASTDNVSKKTAESLINDKKYNYTLHSKQKQKWYKTNINKYEELNYTIKTNKDNQVSVEIYNEDLKLISTRKGSTKKTDYRIKYDGSVFLKILNNKSDKVQFTLTTKKTSVYKKDMYEPNDKLSKVIFESSPSIIFNNKLVANLDNSKDIDNFVFITDNESELNINLFKSNAAKLNVKIYNSNDLLIPVFNQIFINKQTNVKTILKKPGEYIIQCSLIEDSFNNCEYNLELLFNNTANKYLTIPTHDGSNQATHPSVIDFLNEFGINKWNGYRYWMAMTPFPYSNDSHEDPNILASNNGVDWVVPNGINNPLDDKLGSKYTDPDNYNSDAELIYDPDQNCLRIYWREFLRGNWEKIWYKKINYNLSITEKKLTLLNPYPSESLGLSMSTSIWRKKDKEWFMWTSNGTNVSLWESTDGENWGNRKLCSQPWNNWNEGYGVWHLAVKPDNTKNKLIFLLNGYGKNEPRTGMSLAYAEADFNKPDQIIMPIKDLLIDLNINKDLQQIYRASFTIDNKSYGYKLNIWYSSRDLAGKWNISYIEKILNFKP